MNLEKLIQDNTGLIYKISTFFYGVEKDDLYQAGVLGLLKAYKNYDLKSKCKFSTYAYEYIYGEMYALVNSKTIKVSNSILSLYKVIEKTRFSLAQKINKIPTNEEVALYLGVPIQSVNEAIMSGEKIMSLENEEIKLYDQLGREDNLDNRLLISEGIEMLKEPEKSIIKARYLEDQTQSEVAKKLKMSQVKVSRYEKKGLNSMHSYLSIN